MTPDDLRAWQLRLGMTQPEAASALGVPSPTYFGWVQGRRSIPPMVARLCWYIEQYGVARNPETR